MQLPYSEELNIGQLSRIFDNTTKCYKFLWFYAIVQKSDNNHRSFTYDELVNEMIAFAWYMVTEYHLRLGPLGTTEGLEEVVMYIYDHYNFCSSEKRVKIIEFLQSTKDKKIIKYKKDLTRNVPYRLQAPFYDAVITGKKMDCSKIRLINEINCQKRLMYYFGTFSNLSTIIKVDEKWAEYLYKNKEILKGWTQLKLIHYLQNKNPSVPGIADKIEPPVERNIERVRKYWKLIIKKDPTIKDIYGDIVLNDVDISIDHFIPWQYVAHDELWNLHPTTKSINSSKSNSLPSWKKYFELLGELEYHAYVMRDQYEDIAHEFNKIAPYHLNNQDIRNLLYVKGLNKNDFIERLEHVIRPVYESAQTLGFKEWVYER
ncbi:HNH endonuclease domain-containing protein [Kandleria vitulina]|uniref:HNH endonuclease domain-containing protein n=1 Tax=Kandleria vitulina TaxID=1630 RepID=UPI000490BA64|nr:HNH endonuclease domain-containing protein [Kandleria vitulina]